MIGEDVPQADNRVELDPTVHDVYGRPAPRITYTRHPHDQLLVDTYMPKLPEIARAAGASTVDATTLRRRRRARAPSTCSAPRAWAPTRRKSGDRPLGPAPRRWRTSGSPTAASGPRRPRSTRRSRSRRWRCVRRSRSTRRCPNERSRVAAHGTVVAHRLR